jgi:hypothetical protein
LEELKKTFKHERNLREIRPREEELRKSILLARLDEFLEKLGPEDKGMILKSARSLGSNTDFVKRLKANIFYTFVWKKTIPSLVGFGWN